MIMTKCPLFLLLAFILGTVVTRAGNADHDVVVSKGMQAGTQIYVVGVKNLNHTRTIVATVSITVESVSATGPQTSKQDVTLTPLQLKTVASIDTSGGAAVLGATATAKYQ